MKKIAKHNLRLLILLVLGNTVIILSQGLYAELIFLLGQLLGFGVMNSIRGS